jgi:hypothetical protein
MWKPEILHSIYSNRRKVKDKTENMTEVSGITRNKKAEGRA